MLGIARLKTKQPDAVTITRRPFRNKSDATLRKVMVNVQFDNGSHHNLVFIEYHFDGEEHKIKVQAHGNSKVCVPYLRTFTSTKLALQKELQTHKSIPRAIFKTTQAVGGVASSSCGGAALQKEEIRLSS